MSQPTSAGMGQGAAQVFGQSAATQYVQNLRMGLAQQRQDKMATQKLLATFDTQRDKMRPQDIEEFNSRYNELQSLYSNNKELYSNPRKNPELYRRSMELQSELRQIANDSRQQNEYFRAIAAGKMQDPDRFDDKTTEAILRYNQLPTSAIKNNLGGSLLDPLHLEYQPKPFDMAKFGKDYEDFAERSGGVKTQFETRDLGEGRLLDVKKKSYTPESAMQFAAMNFEDNSIFRKNMAKAWRDSAPASVQGLQADLNTYMASVGKESFEIRDPFTYAQARSVMMFNKGKEEMSPAADPAFAEAGRNARFWAGQRAADNRQAKSLAARGKTGQDVLAADVEKVIDLAATGNVKEVITGIAPILNQYGAKMGGTPLLSGRKVAEGKGKGFNEFVSTAKKYSADAAHDMYKIPEGSLRAIWENGGSIIHIPVKMAVEEPVKDSNGKQVMQNGVPKMKTVDKVKYINIIGDKSILKQEAGKLMGFMKFAGASEKAGADRFSTVTPSVDMDFDD